MSSNSEQVGLSFLDAVKDRYGAPDDTAAYSKEAFLVGDASRRKNKSWELVGMDDMRMKQSRLDRITVVSVKDSGVSVAEREAGEITAAKLTNVVELDLSNNARLRMPDIDCIVRQMPKLQLLQLSGIPLATTLSIPQSWNVTKLVLNFTGIDKIDALASVRLPKLEELHLDGNKLATLRFTIAGLTQQFAGVKRLSLAQNALAAWDDGLQDCLEAVFPSLEHVSLSANPLPDLAAVAAEKLAWMSRLTSLWISDCEGISDPRSLEALRLLAPRLDGLRITYKYLFPTLAEAQARALVVASVPSLTNLNNASVRKKERMDADLFYLQRGLAEPAEIRERHYPLVEALKAKYAGVVLSQGTGANASAAHVMLKLRFRMDGKAEEMKTLPSSLHVEKLRALVRTMFDVEPPQQLLSFSAADLGGLAPPIPLDNDLQTLAYFGVGSDAVIHVVDLSAEKKK